MNRAVDFEISRQVNLHNQGQGNQIVQETRLWDDGSQVSNCKSVIFLKILLFIKVRFIHPLNDLCVL